MPEETPPEGHTPHPGADVGPGDAVTEGGYAYTVVEHGKGAGGVRRAPRAAMPTLQVPLLALVAGVVLPAVVVGAAVWFLAPGRGGEDSGRVAANVTNVVNAFSQGRGGTVSTRFEGELAPGFPSDIPLYPGATLVSSELQISGADADYLVVYDTHDGRQKVADFYNDKLAADPWQIEAAQDGRDSSLRQFSNATDANVSGLVLVAESKDDNLTTVILSVQVTSGATSIAKTPFTPGESRALPDGFPDAVPAYPGATVIESAFQKSSGARRFAVSLVTRDSVEQVVDYYRQQLQSAGLTVEDGDASSSSLENATAVQFSNSGQTVGGEIVAGTFADDSDFTRVDITAATR